MTETDRTVFDPPRHRYVDRAMRLARVWCAGHIIDDAPAFTHAVLVARTLVHYVPDVPPHLVAATLLHDAPDFAPAGLPLDPVLNGVGDGVAPIVRALAAEHAAMDAGERPKLDDLAVVLVSAADKIVAFRSLVERAQRSGDEAGFWARRTALRDLMPIFGEWRDLATPLLPTTMAADLTAALHTLAAASSVAPGGPGPLGCDQIQTGKPA